MMSTFIPHSVWSTLTWTILMQMSENTKVPDIDEGS